MDDIDKIDFPHDFQTGTGPLVSIILATYEPEEYIYESLESVANQTYDNIELVIVDSSGENFLKELSDTYTWIEYVRQDPIGVSAAWNRGVDIATGDVISFLADDDYYASEKLEVQVNALQDGADIVYSDEYVIDDNANITRLSALPVDDPATHYIDFFCVGHGIPHLTVAGWRDCFVRMRFSEELPAREDPHLWVRLFREYDPRYIPQALAYKRRRDDSLTSDPNEMFSYELKEVNDLVSRFEELEPYRETRVKWAEYRFGKGLLRQGENLNAVRVFLSVIKKGFWKPRIFALLFISLLPSKNHHVYQQLEKVQEKYLK